MKALSLPSWRQSSSRAGEYMPLSIGAVAKLATGCTGGVLAVEEEASHPVAVTLDLLRTKLLSKASFTADFQVLDAI